MKKNYKIQITNGLASHRFQLIRCKVNLRELRDLKASIPLLHANTNELYNNRHFDAFAAGSIHLKKPSGGPQGLIGPPCHGAPGRRRQQ